MNKKISMRLPIIAAMVVLGYELKKEKEKNNKLTLRISNLEKKAGKLDRFQKIYVALLREYSDAGSEGYSTRIYEKIASNEIKTIAIYGCGPMGKLFADLLINSPIKIHAYIDKNIRELEYRGIPVCSLETVTEMEPVDCIIVMPVYEYNSILADLYARGRDEEITPVTSFIQTI